MATMVWVCLLCLQGCLLTHALDCMGRSVDCASTQVTEVKVRFGLRSCMAGECKTLHLGCKSIVSAFHHSLLKVFFSPELQLLSGTCTVGFTCVITQL